MRFLHAVVAGSVMLSGRLMGQEGGFPFRGKVEAEQLYVRMLPRANAESTIVGVVKQGEVVTVVGEQDGFYSILAPKGCLTWVPSSALRIEGEEAQVVRKTEVRVDSRVSAAVVGSLEEGEKVKVVREYLGWCKIEGGTGLKFWVSKKYVRREDSAQERPRETSAVPADGGKLKKAEELAAKAQEAMAAGRMDECDLNAVAQAFEEAAEEAKDTKTAQYSRSSARFYRRLQGLVTALEAPTKEFEEKRKELDEARAKLEAVRNKEYAFKGCVAFTGAFLPNRPGTHKLVQDGKTVCFLRIREGDEEMRSRLNGLYGCYVGVNGTVIPNPEGWAGYNVVIVEEVVRLEPDRLVAGMVGDSAQEGGDPK